MTVRLLAPALLAGLIACTARAADDNPYKNAKVGDSVTYKLAVKVAGQTLEGATTQTVTAKTDKEATVEVSGKMAGMDIPKQTQKIDLTKPYDPTSAANLPQGADAKIEKLKDGKEAVTVGGKEYKDAEWATYKMKGKAMGIDIDADFKVWTSKSVPLGMLKMEMNSMVVGQKMEMTMEMEKAASKK